jgi:hypothetical protein
MMNCTYGTCSSQTAITAACESGIWRWHEGVCPVMSQP